MASWAGLRSYIQSNYTIADEGPGFIALEFRIDGGRTQRVTVNLEAMGDRDWIAIQSAFGEVGQVDVAAALDLVGGRIFGAIGKIGDFYVVKHSAPLADLNDEEFEYPLHLTMSIADEIENKLGIGDRF